MLITPCHYAISRYAHMPRRCCLLMLPYAMFLLLRLMLMHCLLLPHTLLSLRARHAAALLMPFSHTLAAATLDATPFAAFFFDAIYALFSARRVMMMPAPRRHYFVDLRDMAAARFDTLSMLIDAYATLLRCCAIDAVMPIRVAPAVSPPCHARYCSPAAVCCLMFRRLMLCRWRHTLCCLRC